MLRRRSFHNFREGRLRLSQCDAVLRTLWAGHRGLNRSQIQFQRVVKERRWRLICPKKHLLFAISFDKRDLLSRTRCKLQIRERLRVNGEETHGRAILGSHVRDRRAIGNAQRRQS